MHTATATAQVTIEGTTAKIVIDGTVYRTDARTARNLVDATDVIRSTRLEANLARHEGDAVKADRLDLWEVGFMDRMRRQNCASIVAGLVAGLHRR